MYWRVSWESSLLSIPSGTRTGRPRAIVTSGCLRVDSISGAASDSVSLISAFQAGKLIVGSDMTMAH